VVAIWLVFLGALTTPTIVAAEEEPQPDQATTTQPPADEAPPAEAEPTATPPAAKEQKAEPPAATQSRKQSNVADPKSEPRAKASAPQAQASALQFVVMQDGNKFVPPTKTVDEGDTVEWTNEDDAPHNVTANDGSFQSKQQMANGETFRHKFNSTGTFAYNCTLHPGMDGTIKVEAAAGTSGGGTGAGGGSTPLSPPTATVAGGEPSPSGEGSGGSLPATGSHLLTLALIGADLLLAGLVLREALERRRA
jgi:plastocyanin